MANPDRVIDFLKEVQAMFETFCISQNGNTGLNKQSWDSPLGKIDVALSCGDVLEKASYIYCDLEIDTPPVLAEKMHWEGEKMQAIVLEIGIHPVNPHIPKSYIELRANIAGSVVLAGGTDIFPYITHQRDITLFSEKLQVLCKQYGLDYEQMRKTRIDFFTSKYSKENVGSHAGLYFFYMEEDKFEFFKDMAMSFFETYGELVEKRKKENFTQHDRDHMQRLHGKWAQWILLEDEGTRFGLDKGIPPEALLGAILPPIAKF